MVAVYAMFPTIEDHSIYSYVPGGVLLKAVKDQMSLIQQKAEVSVLNIHIANGNDKEERPWGLYTAVGVGGLFVFCLIVICCK